MQEAGTLCAGFLLWRAQVVASTGGGAAQVVARAGGGAAQVAVRAYLPYNETHRCLQVDVQAV
ncbi:MAG: hypothetical protein K6G23_08005 [Lachnospiraceae bacterium]|nr:hypothetical protein [Lachnospiraceae bacterium]